MGKTPDDIKKGLEYCGNNPYCDGDCEYYESADSYGCKLSNDALAYIQKLEERSSKLEYTLLGVMHSVDKWLDVEQYDFDKDDGTVAATRASNAREIALKAIEKAQADLAQVERERDAMSYDMHQLQGALCAYCENLYRPAGSKKVSCKVFGDGYGAEDGSPLICGRFKWRGVCVENTKEEA